MGLILAGAGMGGGAALQQFGAQLQRDWSAERLDAMRNDAANSRQAALIEAQKFMVEHTAQTQLKYAPEMGKAAAQSKLLEQEALAPGKLEAARAEGDIRVDIARRSPRTIGEGSTEIVDGQPGFTAPKTDAPKPKELLDYYGAAANRYNAEADAIREGVKYKGPADKTLLPQIKIEKDSSGNPYMVDAVSGAIGVIREGTPAKEAKSNWFSADEPAVPAGPPRVDWSINGKALPNGLNELYPSMKGQGIGKPDTNPKDTGLDPDTGAVILNGKQIGSVDMKASTARADAKAMVRKAQAEGGAGKSAPTGPTAGDISFLKNNASSEMKAAFDAQFGVGRAAKALSQPASSPISTSGLIGSGAPSAAESGADAATKPDTARGAVARSIARSAESHRSTMDSAKADFRERLAFQAQFDADNSTMDPAKLIEKYEKQRDLLSAFQRGALDQAREKVMDRSEKLRGFLSVQ